MVNDPAPIKDLADRLDDLTVTIAKSQPVRGRSRDVCARPGSSKPETFYDIKAATDTPERRDNLHVQIEQGVRPAARRRRARPRHPAPQRGVAAGSCRSSTVGQPPIEAHLVPRERVVPERIVKPDGPVGREFVAAFTTPRIGETLFQPGRRAARRPPTLTYEPDDHRPAPRGGPQRGRRASTTPSRKGDVLVEQGQAIGEEQLILLRMEHEAANARWPRATGSRRALGILVLVAALFAPDRLLRLPPRAARSPATSADRRRSAAWSSLAIGRRPAAGHPALGRRARSRWPSPR